MPGLGLAIGIGRARQSGGGGVPAPEPPPVTPAYWFDMTDSSTMSLSGATVQSVTDTQSSIVATGASGTEPAFFSNPADLPALGGRVRFTGGDFLTVPTGASFNKQAVSFLIIARYNPGSSSAARGTFFNAPGATGPNLALYVWDNGEYRIWTGSAVSTAVYLGGGLTAVWGRFGSGGAVVGVDGQQYSMAALTAGTLTGARIGLWTATNFPLDGDIQQLLVWNSDIGATSMADVLSWAQSRYGTPSRDCIILFDGDSITNGISDANPQITPHARDYSFPSQVQLSFSERPRILNNGRGGASLANELTSLSSKIGFYSGVGRRIVFGLWGTNDLASGVRTDAQLKADLDTWIANIRAADAGAIIGHGTILPRNSGWDATKEGYRTSFNNYVKDTSVSGPDLDFFVDTAAITELTDPSDTTYYFDGLHPTIPDGYAALAAGVYPELLAQADAP